MRQRNRQVSDICKALPDNHWANVVHVAARYNARKRAPKNALYRVDGLLYEGIKGDLQSIWLVARDTWWNRLLYRLGVL